MFKVIRSIVEEKMDISGGYAKPKIWDVLLVQLVVLPYTTFLWSRFYSRWLWKFGIRREEYGLDEKNYVIRRNMKLSEGQFNVSGLNRQSFTRGEADNFNCFAI
jgi:DnaJ family protein C protein 25